MRIAVAGVCVLLTVLGLACGDDSPDPSRGETGTAEDSASRNIVTDRDIRATPPRSPQRSLFRFFQAVQFQDFQAVNELITRRERRSLGEGELRAAISVVGPSLGKPRVLGVRRRGDIAVARVLVLGFVPGKEEASSATPASFSFREERAQWRLSDLSYLIRTGNAISREEHRRDAQRR